MINTLKSTFLEDDIYSVIKEKHTSRYKGVQMITNLYETFLRTIPCPIWIIGKDKRYKYVNSLYRNLYNLENVEVIGKTIGQIIPKEYSHLFSKRLDNIIEHRETKIYEMELGSRVMQCYSFPIKDNGDIRGVAGIIIDVSDRREREHEIIRQKNILQAIIDTIPDPIFQKDINGVYVTANKSSKEQLSPMCTDIIGKTDEEVMFDKELARKVMNDDKEILNNRKIIRTEPKMELPSGEIRTKECVKAPIISNDNVIGIVGLARDVTEKKAMEDKLKYLSYTDILTGLYNRTSFNECAVNIQKKENLPIAVIMGDVNGLKLINDTFGHIEGDRLLISISAVLKECCGNSSNIFRWGGDEFVIILPHTDGEKCKELINNIKTECKINTSNLVELSISLGQSIQENLESNIYDHLKIAEERVYRHKLLEHNSLISSLVLSLLKTLETKSLETEQHTERMVRSSVIIGNKMNLSPSNMDELVLATKLHDIGKIVIDEDILLKPDRLTEEEYDIMKTHSEKGYRIVRAAHGLENVAEGVLSHHERYDGKGYPMGIKGEDIPLIARIISVVDAYDAMTNDRVYKKAMSKYEAIEELIKGKNGQFDPEIVDILVSYLK